MKGKKLGAIFLAATMLTGCGGTELNEEQSTLVAQYAAGLLLKYDKNYTDNLLTDEEIAVAEEAERLAAEKAAELEKIREEMLNDAKTEQAESPEGTGNDGQNQGAEDVEEPKYSMNDILKVEGFDIQYTGYELLDTYPSTEDATEDGDVYFSLSAAPERKLLTMRFRITNTTTEVAKISLVDKEMLCKLVMPDGSKKNAMMTMLLNDLAFYDEELQTGESQEAVVIFEVKNDINLEKFNLSVVIGENAYMVAL